KASHAASISRITDPAACACNGQNHRKPRPSRKRWQSARLGRRAEARFWGKKLPVACRIKAGERTVNVACLSGFCGFVSFVTDPECKKGDPQVALSLRRLPGLYVGSGGGI